MENSLLLTAGYEPLKIIDWRRAVVMVLLGKVEVVEEYSRVIHSPSVTIALPAVVRLNRMVKRAPRRVKFSRQNIFFRDNFTCQYCHGSYPPHKLTYDHVVPRSQGGSTNWTNIVTACIRCNLKKGSKSLKAADYRLIRKPVEPKWLPVFTPQFNEESAPEPWKNYLALAGG